VVLRNFRRPPTIALCKGAPGLFSSMNDDVWMLALGIGGTVKGSIVASSPGEREPTLPRRGDLRKILLPSNKLHSAGCILLILCPIFCPLHLTSSPPPSLPRSPRFLQLSLDVVTQESVIQSANDNKYSLNYSQKQH